MQDIQAVVESAFESYQQRRKSRALMEWLSKAASHIQFYGKVFDVVSQHHPEYVALGWGAVKFFLMVFGLLSSALYPYQHDYQTYRLAGCHQP